MSAPNLFKRRETFSPWQNYLVSSLIASFTESLVFCPPEAERIRQILRINVPNKWSPKVLYKGYLPTLGRSVTSSTSTFCWTDLLLDYFDPERESKLSSFVYGTFAGIVSQLITAPVEVVKTRVMGDYGERRSMLWHFRDLYRSGGFTKSIIPRGILTGLRCGFIIGGMNMAKEFIENR